LEGEYDRPPALAEILPLLDLFGARYVVSDSLDSDLNLPLIYDTGPRIYDNDGALPTAYVVPRARVVEDAGARLDQLLDPGFDPRAEVLLSAPPESPPPVDEGAVAGNAVAYVLRQEAGRIWVDVRTPYAGYLVLSDTDYPGWRASVDGEPVEILQANHAFRAVIVNGGEHLVLFEYAPRSFQMGAGITLAAGLLWLATAVAAWRRRRQR
jgi:hypothetical protein